MAINSLFDTSSSPANTSFSAPASGISGLLGSLMGGLGGLSGLASAGLNAFIQFNAYNSERNLFNFQQKQYELQAKAQDLQARQQALAIRKQAEKAIGSAKALFASRGIALGSGSAEQALQLSQENANADIDELMFGNELQRNSLLAEGNILKSKKRLRGISRLQQFGTLLEGYRQGSVSGFDKLSTLKDQEEGKDFYDYGF